jgi:hypothetical protein
MCSVVEVPMEPMIAALRGSTAFEVIAVFQALLAGNGLLIAASTPGFVTAATVVGFFVLPVAVADGVAGAALALGDALDSEELGVADAETVGVASLADVTGSVALWSARVHEPTSSAITTAKPGSSRARGRLTSRRLTTQDGLGDLTTLKV